MDTLGSLSRQVDILKPESVARVLSAFRDYLMPMNNVKTVARNQNVAHGSNAIV